LDDAFLALKAVEEGPAYHIAELIFFMPHNPFCHEPPFSYQRRV
jgi:hypothetical protein